MTRCSIFALMVSVAALAAGCSSSSSPGGSAQEDGQRDAKRAEAERRVAAKKAEREAARKAAIPDAAGRAKILAGLKAKKDEFKKVTFYEDPVAESSYDSRVYAYIVEGNESSAQYSLRLVVCYHGEDWVFWRKAHFKAGNEIVALVPAKVTRDNSSTVWEVADVLAVSGIVGDEQLKFTTDGGPVFAKLMQAKPPVSMRYEGSDKESDRVIQADELKRFQAVGQKFMALFGLK